MMQSYQICILECKLYEFASMYATEFWVKFNAKGQATPLAPASSQ
jgi:hypothetical protein